MTHSVSAVFMTREYEDFTQTLAHEAFYCIQRNSTVCYRAESLDAQLIGKIIVRLPSIKMVHTVPISVIVWQPVPQLPSVDPP